MGNVTELQPVNKTITALSNAAEASVGLRSLPRLQSLRAALRRALRLETSQVAKCFRA
jgi:hypothetical protein